MICKNFFNISGLFVSIFCCVLNSAQATTINIVNVGNTTKNTTDGDIISTNLILFTSAAGGTLNHNAGSAKTLAGISTDNDGIGTITINTINDLDINGDIGSSSKAINQIIFSQFQNLSVTGSIYTQNGINADADGKGDLLLFGQDSIIHSNIGSSGLALDLITINNSNIGFVGDVFTDNFVINPNRSATFQSATANNNNFGNVDLKTGASFTINSDLNLSTLSTTSSSTITIAAGKKITADGVLSFNGNLNLGILRSDSSTPLITSSSNITIVDGLKIHFDYSNATYLKKDDTYDFITASGTLSANSTLLNDDRNLTDTSILLAPSIVTVSGSPNSIRVTQDIDSTTTAALSTNDLATANFVIDNTTIAQIDSARTALFKISTQSELKDALSTLQVDRSNMLQQTAVNISSSIENILEYRVQSLNYQQSQATSVRDLIRTTNTNKNEVALVKSGGLWAQTFGATAKQSDITTISAGISTTTKGYDTDFAGVSFGLDKVFKGETTNSIWGGAISYSKASAESRTLSKQKTDIDSYQFSLYNQNIARSGLGFFSENFLSIGHNQYNSERTVDLITYQSKAESDFSGMQYGAKFGLGYNFKMSEKSIFAPIAGIKYFGLKLQDYQEKDTGGFGLKVENDYFDLTTSELGFRMTGSIGSKIEPQINVAWLHNLSADGAKSSSTFVNGSTTQAKMQNSGIDLDADILNAGAQIKFQTSKNTSFMLKYDLQKSTNFTSHLGSAKFAWAF